MKILGVLIIAAGFVLFAQYQIPAAIISILIGSVFFAYPGKRFLDGIFSEPDDESADGELVRVDAPSQQVRSTHSGHRRLAFPVDGVTIPNDDGSSRQEILRTLCDNEDIAVAEVWFDDYLSAANRPSVL